MSLYRTQSLRAKLLWYLLVAISLVAAAQAIIAYRTALAEADAMFDYQMQQMAMSLRTGFAIGAKSGGDIKIEEAENFDFAVQVWTTEGLRVFPTTSRVELPAHTALGFATVQTRNTNYRVYSIASGSQVIQVVQDLSARHEMAGTLALRTVGPMVVMVPLLMMVVWWVVTASLATVSRVRSQVAARQADDLRAVSEAGLPDEIRPLVHELNLLLQRMRQSFDVQNKFVADAAHELRSPLSALKLQVQGLRRAADEAAREVAINRLGSGIDRSTRLVEQLLVLARQQASTVAGVKSKPVNLTNVARLALTDAVPAALARQIDIGLDNADDGMVMGHEEALHIMIRNLLDNAIKYTPLAGKVDLAIHDHEGNIVLTVEDNGSGIPVQDRTRVLDRFYRVPGTVASGSGLGLAIVRDISKLHAATLLLDSSPRLGGLRVTVAFPNRSKMIRSALA